jgi:hypothetical protein
MADGGAILIPSVSLGKGGDGAPVPVAGEEGAVAHGLAWRATLDDERAWRPVGLWR